MVYALAKEDASSTAWLSAPSSRRDLARKIQNNERLFIEDFGFSSGHETGFATNLRIDGADVVSNPRVGYVRTRVNWDELEALRGEAGESVFASLQRSASCLEHVSDSEFTRVSQRHTDMLRIAQHGAAMACNGDEAARMSEQLRGQRRVRVHPRLRLRREEDLPPLGDSRRRGARVAAAVPDIARGLRR